MRVWLVLFTAILVCVPTGLAGEDPPPPNEPPQLWRASASVRDGKVVIQIARPEFVAPRRAAPAEAMKWHNLKTVTLGETVRAFEVDGKRLEPKAVLEALAQPSGVAVFVRFNHPLLDPDPFYLGMLRAGTVALVVGAGEVADPKP